jgi:poly(3-hydroxybutyrate) depolymerase
VEVRSYLFEETGEMLEYAVFVSSKIKEDSKKIPLVIALHGRGAHPTSILGHAAGPAERGGYVVAAPMGYNDHGWYGLLESERTTPARVREYSEKDVMNVLAMMRKEFDIDENRIYLMGQSMGGAGVYFIAVKHPDIWAAVASGAPPLRRATHGETIAGIPNIRHIPFILVHGERDGSVTVEVSRRIAGRMEQLGMTHEYHEIPGGGHPDAVRVGAPWMFSFFDRHIKSTAPAPAGLWAAPTAAPQPMNGTATRLRSALRSGTATIAQVRTFMQGEHVNVFPEVPLVQASFAIRELDLDFDGVNDIVMERYARLEGGGAYSAFLATPRGHRYIGSFFGDIRPLRAEPGQRARFVIASAMGSDRVHVRLAELRPDGLHQLATAVLLAGDTGTAEGNRLHRELMSADVVSAETLRRVFAQ